jgi:hypothetical protein
MIPNSVWNKQAVRLLPNCQIHCGHSEDPSLLIETAGQITGSGQHPSLSWQEPEAGKGVLLQKSWGKEAVMVPTTF